MFYHSFSFSFLLVQYAFCLFMHSRCTTEPGPVKRAVSEASPPVAMTYSTSEAVLLGKFDPANHPDFEAVKKPYTDRPDMWMQRKAFAAYQQMYEAAQKDGIVLKIISSTRTFSQQKVIWERKWERFASETPDPAARAAKILEYSSMPGTSRHHWGTDIDLNDLNNPAFEPGGRYSKVYEWLTAHAYEYGFCQPYSQKNEERPAGYNEERWHWSYTPLSKPFLKQYREIFNDNSIEGFKGSETARSLQVVKNYVCGIRAACAND